MQDHSPTLGKPPGPDDRRDAIHVAIAPVVAAYLIIPGQRVGRMPDGTFGSTGETIGVADPFRSDLIKQGERFWLLLDPGTVTGLRHCWSHPAFTPQPPKEQS